VKPTALPANQVVRVDCLMSRGYFTGKGLRTPDLDNPGQVEREAVSSQIQKNPNFWGD